MREIRNYNLKLKGLADTGEFEGVASVYGNKDSYGDVVEAGAFTKTIQENPEIAVLYQHYDPIGKGTVEDSAGGLLIRGKLLLEVKQAQEAYALAKANIVKGLSIGYRVIKDEWDSAKQVRRLLEVKLYEVSLVTFPANELAGITGIKGFDFAAWEDIMQEVKAGRTLSAATRARLQKLSDDIQALLSEADADDEAAKSLRIEPDEFHSMISDWRKAR